MLSQQTYVEPLYCKRCNSTINESKNQPIYLPCGDQTCLSCLCRMVGGIPFKGKVSQEPHKQQTFQCPICLLKFAISRTLIQQVAKIWQKSGSKRHAKAFKKGRHYQLGSYKGDEIKETQLEFESDETLDSDDDDQQDQCKDQYQQYTQETLIFYDQSNIHQISINQVQVSTGKTDQEQSILISIPIAPLQKSLEIFEIAEIKQQEGDIKMEEEIEIFPYDESGREDDMQFDEYTVRTFDLTSEKVQLLQEWLENEARFQLIQQVSKYKKISILKCTQHGITPSAFHEHCDKHGPTLTLVKSEHGRVFGGFTSVSWKSPLRATCEKDNRAFVFSLTHQERYALKTFNGPAVVHCKDFMAVFGRDVLRDIFLQRNDSRKANNNTRDIGANFKIPRQIQIVILLFQCHIIIFEW